MVTASASDAPPRVFISYSHDGQAHKARVLELSERLRSEGIDAQIDQYETEPAAGWPRWMERQIAEADFVLLVCTEAYHRRVTQEEEPGIGRGVTWEANLIYNELYHENTDTQRFVPLFFGAIDTDHIPRPLRGRSCYSVGAQDDYDSLYRLLTAQPAAVPGPLGRRRSLQSKRPPAREAVPLTPVRAAERYFISYSRRTEDDANLARYLHTELTEAEQEVFIDISMKGGVKWLDEISKRVEWCDHLILLLSRDSAASEMVLREVRMAIRRARREERPTIIPVRVNFQGRLTAQLNALIGELQYIEWQGTGDSPAVLEQVLYSTQPDAAPEPEAAAAVRRDREPSGADSPARPASPEPSTSWNPTVAGDGGDPAYIERRSDEMVLESAANLGQTVVVKAPHQMGKSSLLCRYLERCRDGGKAIAVVNFEDFEQKDFETYPNLLSAVAWGLNDALDRDDRPRIEWQRDMVSYVDREIVRNLNAPLTIAFDDVDRVMGHDYQEDFFSMLRSFHDRRNKPHRPWWRSVDLMLVISTEPHLLISRKQRSPFNVGLSTQLEPFTLEESHELNRRHGEFLARDEVEELYELVRGHPFLSRLAYDRMMSPGGPSCERLIETAHEEHGPFGEHLRAKLADIEEKTDLSEGMLTLLDPDREPDRDTFHRLHGAGLAARNADGHAEPANVLYERYFMHSLNA